MNNFEKIQEDELRRRANAAEGREMGAESSKEGQENQELKKMGAMERVEKTSREVKNTQKQMQNIMANMQTVVKAVQTIRQQLELTEPDENIPSVARDQKNLQDLRKKLAGLTGHLADLRTALFQEEYKKMKKIHSGWSVDQLKQETEKIVVRILEKLSLSSV